MPAELCPPTAFFLMREETEETSKSHKGCDHHRVPNAVGGHREAKGAVEGKFRQRGRGSHGEDALKELEGQGRGALRGGGEELQSREGTAWQEGLHELISSSQSFTTATPTPPQPAPQARAE